MAAKRKTAKSERPSSEVERWCGHIALYERQFKKWESRVEKIIKRYRDEGRSETHSGARFNILWSNVQTLSAATFAQLPKPDVSRRFRDNDPVGRVASLILERALDYEVEHYSDYRATLSASVLDRFLGGRATAWVRYEPHFRAVEQALPEEGLQVTEDTEVPDEELEYECAPCDYVHWRDFGHLIARTWEECPAVWRKVYMTREALIARFGEEVGNKVPLDAKPEEMKDSQLGEGAELSRGCVYEIWDKESKRAIWLAKSVKEILDQRDDPLGLEEFFPCPRPLYATLTNEKLEPVPDFTLYQDQAAELDLLSSRIDSLLEALQVRGVYDASLPELSRLFTEGHDNALLPVKNWAAFAEKQGLKGAIDLVDLSNIVGALQAAYQAAEQVKNQVYEITGISDIVRGQTAASETATAQQIKGQYASLRLRTYQSQVGAYAQEMLQLKAQIMCNKFAPATLIKLSAAEQLSEQDQQLVPQAMQLLLGERVANPEATTPNPLRAFRVEIAADSMIHLDEEQEKTSRMEFLQAQGSFMKEFVAPVLQAPPTIQAILAPVMMETWKFGTTAFKVGKSIEGAFDEAAEKLKQLAAQPQQPQIPPEMVQQMQEQAMQQAQQQVDQKNASKDIAYNAKAAKQDLDHAKRSAQLDVREMKFNASQEIASEKQRATAMEVENTHREIDTEAVNAVKELLRGYQDKVGQLVQTEVSKSEEKENVVGAQAKVTELNNQVLGEITQVLRALSAPKRVIRDAEGRAIGMEPVL